jgi:hypothetical protein
MRRFENPDRYLCLHEDKHAAILKAKEDAKKRKAEGGARGRATQAKRGPTARQRAQGGKVGKAYGGRNKKEKTASSETPKKRKHVRNRAGTRWVKTARISTARNQPRDPKTGKFVKRKKNGK